MSVNFSSVTFEWYNGYGTWFDLTPDILTEPHPRGASGGGIDLAARVANPGSLTFTLNNSESNSTGEVGRYTPGHENCIGSNWGKPYFYPLRVTWSYDERVKVKRYTFEPRGGVKVTPGVKGARTVTVTLRDWMGFALERKISLFEIQTEKRIDEAMLTLMELLAESERPQHYLFFEGDSTFTTVFDSSNSGTTLFEEFNKLAMSELGYIYLKSDRTNGENLVAENRNRRYQAGGTLYASGGSLDTTGDLLLETGDYLLNEDGDHIVIDFAYRTVSNVSISSEDCGFLLLETGDYLLTEDGDNIILNEVQEATFEETDILENAGFDVDHFANAYQSARVSVQQKETGQSVIVLWSAERPIQIAAGQTLTGIRGRYRDPSGADSYINGSDIVTPVMTTDYLCNTAQDGSGSDLSANLSVSATSGGAEVEFTITNSGAAGWITLLQVRGYGVYNYDSLDLVAYENDGLSRFDVNLQYETDETVGRTYVNQITRKPFGDLAINRMPLWANRDKFNINAWMDLDIGSLYNATEAVTGVENNNPYFINGYEWELFYADGNPQVMWYPNGFPYSRVYIPE